MGVPEIEAFLSHLATTEQVAASTQNQAFSALLFLYRQVLQIPLDERIDALRAKRSRHLPTVLTPDEAKAILQQMSGRQLSVTICTKVVKTTMIYTHVLNRGGRGVRSPLDV